MKAKHVIKRLYGLYKEGENEDAELQIKVKEDDLIGKIYLPINPKDIKIETIDDITVIIIDLS